MLSPIEPRWRGATCIVAATGPSFTAEVAEACRGYPTIAVNDAYRLFPWADILYASDGAWFAGERWSSVSATPIPPRPLLRARA
jgi:hypothetical protein